MNEDRMSFLSEWITLADTHLKRPSDRLAFYDAVLRYGIFGQLPNAKGMVSVCFECAKVKIDEMQNRKNRYRSSVEKRQLSNNCPTNGRQLSNNCPTNAEKEKENKKEVSPLSPSSRIKQENKETHSAHAHTDAHALKATAEKTSEAEDFADLIPEQFRNDAGFMSEWHEWLDFRRKNRKKVSRMAAARQLNLLGKYIASDAIRIIETSITNDWQGLFPCKVGNIKPIRDYTGI